jgi:hypothetical protein
MSRIGIIALGTTQITAQPIHAGQTFSQVSTCTTSANGVVLPGTVIGGVAGGSSAIILNEDIYIRNDGVTALNVYPPTGAHINNLATNIAISILPGNAAIIRYINTTQAFASILLAPTVAIATDHVIDTISPVIFHPLMKTTIQGGSHT